MFHNLKNYDTHLNMQELRKFYCRRNKCHSKQARKIYEL